MSSSSKGYGGYSYQKLSEEEDTEPQPYLVSSSRVTSKDWLSSARKMAPVSHQWKQVHKGGGNPGGAGGLPAEDLELRTRGRGGNGVGSRAYQALFHHAAPFDQDNTCSIIERKIQDGETLQKISLQYAVSISDLKRVNGLISDQDFYGLKQLKIPVMKYSHVEESLMDSVTKESLSPPEEARSDTSELLPLSDTETFGLGESPSKSSSYICKSQESLYSNEDTHNFNKILKNVDANLVKAKDAAEHLERREEELRDQIFNASNGHADDMHHIESHNSVERTVKHYIVVILILFAILVPLGYLIFHYRAHPSDTN